MAAPKKGEGGAAAKPEPQADTSAVTLESLKADHPDLVGQIETAAKTEERERISAIDKAALPGHEDLVETCKADPNCSPGDAASKILEAEKALRAQQAGGIAGVEEHTGNVPVTPTSANTPRDEPAAAANTPEGWAAQYDADTDEGRKIRAEFPTKGSYVAYMASIQPGATNVVSFGRKSA